MGDIKKPWGFPLWCILHGLIEKIGNQTIPMLINDEAIEILFVLHNVEFIMPCSLCSKHYKEWKNKYPLNAYSKLRGVTLQIALRKWLYDLHENVNNDRNITSGINIDNLPLLYKSVSLDEKWNIFKEHIKVFNGMGLISMAEFKKFTRHFIILKKLLI